LHARFLIRTCLHEAPCCHILGGEVPQEGQLLDSESIATRGRTEREEPVLHLEAKEQLACTAVTNVWNFAFAHEISAPANSAANTGIFSSFVAAVSAQSWHAFSVL
jgi:hypothetical protein